MTLRSQDLQLYLIKVQRELKYLLVLNKNSYEFLFNNFKLKLDQNEHLSY